MGAAGGGGGGGDSFKPNCRPKKELDSNDAARHDVCRCEIRMCFPDQCKLMPTFHGAAFCKSSPALFVFVAAN